MPYTIKFLILISCLFSLQTLVNGDGEEEILQLFVFPAVSNSTKISEQCRKDTEIYKEALLEAQTWAVQMYDASAKIPSGILYGNYMHLGNFDQCLAVKSDDELITGKACIPLLEVSFLKKSLIVNPTSYISDFMETALVKYKTRNRLIIIPFKWLWCVPSSCQVEDIKQTITEIFGDAEYKGSAMTQVYVEEDYCTSALTPSRVPDILDQWYLSLIITITCFVIGCTLYEVNRKKSGSKPTGTRDMICTSFSIFTNFRELFSISTNTDDLRSLYVIRFVSICFVVYFHVITQYFISSPVNLADFIDNMRGWRGIIIVNFVLAVDVFFFLAGLVLAYNEATRAINNPNEYAKSWLWLPKFYFQRWIRLTPCYMLMIGFYATWFCYIGSGPIWNAYSTELREATREEWFYHAIYFGNFGYTSKAMPQAWYLTLLMQMYFVSPLFLYLMIVKGGDHPYTFLVLAGVLLTNVFSPFILTYVNDLPDLTNWFLVPETIDDFRRSEINNFFICEGLYVRIGPYLLGMMMGFYLKYFKKNHPEMDIFSIMLGWLCVVVGMIYVLFGCNGRRKYEPFYNPFRAAIYSCLYRLVFACIIGWIVLTTECGYNGAFGKMLMWPAWKPLGKLTFCIYLVHFLPMFYNIGTMRSPPSMRTWDMMRDFCGYLGFSIVIALILCLFVEMPVARLVRFFSKRSVSADDPGTPIFCGRRSKAVKEI